MKAKAFVLYLCLTTLQEDPCVIVMKQ
uniref:Uncharacterized protein n=1 Tax=Anguilla anguilla TaxID=7936 RepID=A0A0E9S472_ANGAN